MNSKEPNMRQYTRLPKPYRVEAKELKFPIAREVALEGSCSDISRGGLCVESRTALAVGTVLQVKVHIPLLNKFSSSFFKIYENDAEQFLQTIAEVAWIKPVAGRYLIGLRFANADEDSCRALDALIAKAFRDLEK